MSNKIAILTPSFSKADLAWEHYLSMRETAPEADVFIGIDQSDPQWSTYLWNFREDVVGKMNPIICVTKNRKYGPKANEMWKAFPNYDYYFLGSDDVFGLEKGWMKELVKRIPEDGIALLWPDDKLSTPHRNPREIARFPFTTRFVLSTLGYFALPNLCHYYVDDAFTALSKAIGRQGYVSEAKVDHRHTPAPQSPEVMIEDGRIYYEWLNNGFKNDVEKLKEKMK